MSSVLPVHAVLYDAVPGWFMQVNFFDSDFDNFCIAVSKVLCESKTSNRF
jgi:hypothetical protein